MEKYREPTPSSMAVNHGDLFLSGKLLKSPHNRSSAPFNRLRRVCLSKNSIKRPFNANK